MFSSLIRLAFGVVMVSDVSRTLAEIKVAEEKYETIVSEAKKQAEQILAKARDKASKISARTEKQIVKMNDELLRKAEAISKKETDKILSDASKKAKSFQTKTLSKKQLQELVEFVLS